MLRAIRVKGGVINIHVFRAITKTLITSNPSTSMNFQNFSMPRSWVQSIYNQMGLTYRIRTTARPPVPKELYDECRLTYLRSIENNRKKYNIPPELILKSD